MAGMHVLVLGSANIPLVQPREQSLVKLSAYILGMLVQFSTQAQVVLSEKR